MSLPSAVAYHLMELGSEGGMALRLHLKPWTESQSEQYRRVLRPVCSLAPTLASVVPAWVALTRPEMAIDTERLCLLGAF